ncbi:MAG: hypothetical protein LBK94_04665 [Prevotellaceae bacterium]|jgi:hypothetical protein|nr:hypothetical protein [Prevotellaceae bacterium]
MENLSTLDLQIIVNALEAMPEQNSSVMQKRIEALVSDFNTLIIIRENKEKSQKTKYENFKN